MTPQRNLGEALGAALEAGPSRSTLATQRAQVLEALTKPARSARPYLLGGAGAVVATAAAALALRWSAGPSMEELRGAWQGRTLSERARVVAPAERGETLSFSDGSRLQLGARAEIALSKLAPDQAHLELSRGHVDATIRKGTGRAWTLGAGPYSVRVVGTAFSVDWDAESRFFAVTVREGKVLVTGSELVAGGVLLRAGQRLERQGSLMAEGAAPFGSSQSPSEAPVTSAPAPVSSRSELTAAASAEDDFRAQATRGNYATALAAARRVGLERLERELSAKDLLLLANTARYAGTASEARSSLLKLRERFPGSPGAAHAALLLATQAEDREKNPSEAERWLRVFLMESPRGELAAGARARLLAALLKRGARAEAEQVARDYLRLHPSGPHVAQARAVLQASR